MKSETIALLKFIEESKQLEIPIYQRPYSWKKVNCEQLWDDIIEIGQSDEFEPEYFVGTVIYIEKRNGQARYVIDGQQRLTTVALILEALAQFNEANEEEIGASAEELRRWFLFDPSKTGDAAHKLLLSEPDKEPLKALVAQKEAPEKDSSLIHANFDLFREKIRKASTKDRAALWQGLKRLKIISIGLDRSQESPQRVFESMNDRGVELSIADLIRNYVLMNLSTSEQEQLYDAHWEPIEAEFGRTEEGERYSQDKYSKRFDDFIRYYFWMKTGKLPSKDKVYGEFKKYAPKQESINALVADIQKFAGYYSAIKMGREKNLLLKAAFNDLQLLKANTPIPFLMALYDLYSERGAALTVLSDDLPNLPTEKLERAIRELRNTGDISSFSRVIDGSSNSIGSMRAYARSAQKCLLGADQFEQIVRVIESCVVRRSVCAMPSRGMNSLFVKHAHGIHDTKIALERAQKIPVDLKCPNDSDFAQALKENILLGRPHCSYILGRIENYGIGDPLDPDEYDVEPVLPAKGPLSEEWKEKLGENWSQIREELAGTLGNLRLTKGGATFYLSMRWDAETIRERAETLAERALEVWRMP